MTKWPLLEGGTFPIWKLQERGFFGLRQPLEVWPTWWRTVHFDINPRYLPVFSLESGDCQKWRLRGCSERVALNSDSWKHGPWKHQEYVPRLGPRAGCRSVARRGLLVSGSAGGCEGVDRGGPKTAEGGSSDEAFDWGEALGSSLSWNCKFFKDEAESTLTPTTHTRAWDEAAFLTSGDTADCKRRCICTTWRVTKANRELRRHEFAELL